MQFRGESEEFRTDIQNTVSETNEVPGNHKVKLWKWRLQSTKLALYTATYFRQQSQHHQPHWLPYIVTWSLPLPAQLPCSARHSPPSAHLHGMVFPWRCVSFPGFSAHSFTSSLRLFCSAWTGPAVLSRDLKGALYKFDLLNDWLIDRIAFQAINDHNKGSRHLHLTRVHQLLKGCLKDLKGPNFLSATQHDSTVSTGAALNKFTFILLTLVSKGFKRIALTGVWSFVSKLKKSRVCWFTCFLSASTFAKTSRLRKVRPN